MEGAGSREFHGGKLGLKKYVFYISKQRKNAITTLPA
jgi:hypothetical protein